MYKIITLLIGLVVAMTIESPDDAVAAELKVGDTSPLFSMVASDGITYNSKDYNGKQVIVLVWYPKAFTGG